MFLSFLPAFPTMNDAVSPLPSLPAALALGLRLRVALTGLVADFWADGRWGRRHAAQAQADGAQEVAPQDGGGGSLFKKMTGKKKASQALWSGDAIQVCEKLWGEGYVLPGGSDYVDQLAKPLGLNKDTSVLDLSAGLGALGRRLSAEFGSYVTGLEASQVLAARGMVMSIAAGKSKQASVAAYDPATFEGKRKYDCLFARGLFYRVADKAAFCKEVAQSVKSGGGQIVFTDYILDPQMQGKPAVRDWASLEKGAQPLSSLETIKMWKALGFDLRIAEDQTAWYRLQILEGLAAGVAFFSVHAPDESSKVFVARELFLWLTRLRAFDQGLRYYRFFGIKY